MYFTIFQLFSLILLQATGLTPDHRLAGRKFQDSLKSRVIIYISSALLDAIYLKNQDTAILGAANARLWLGMEKGLEKKHNALATLKETEARCR